MNIVTNILAMSSANVAWVQYPTLQSQTSLQAMMKHKHALENMFLKDRLSCQYAIQILYAKPESSARDQRSLSQQGVALFNGNFSDSIFLDSSAVKEGKVGPCPLLRVADFVGFDEETRPGPSARVEQMLVFLAVRNDFRRAVTLTRNEGSFIIMFIY